MNIGLLRIHIKLASATLKVRLKGLDSTTKCKSESAQGSCTGADHLESHCHWIMEVLALRSSLDI
jgi:hypothetical protein